MKKFRLTDNKKTVYNEMTQKHHTVYQIEYLISILGKPVEPGTLGGYVEHEHNLSQEGNCLILRDACIMEQAMVTDNAIVLNQAIVCGNALISEDASIFGSAIIGDYAKIRGQARVSMLSKVYGYTQIGGNARVLGKASINHKEPSSTTNHIEGNACINGDEEGLGVRIEGNVIVKDNACVFDDVLLTDNVQVLEHAELLGSGMIISGNTILTGRCNLYNSITISGETIIGGNVLIRENAKVSSSHLDGHIEILGEASIHLSEIKGEEVIISGKVQIDFSLIYNSQNVFINDSAKVYGMELIDSTFISIRDNVRINFMCSVLHVKGTKIEISGNAEVVDNVLHSRSGSFMQGENIFITDCVKLIGAYEVFGNTCIKEFVQLINNSSDLIRFSGVTLGGDIELTKESA